MTGAKAPVKFVVDSTCDFPAEWAARWDIEVVPAFVNFEHESFPDDGVALPRTEFYRRMAASSKLPTTAAMPPGLAQEAIHKQLARAEHVVVFTLAAQFSGIYNTMVLAAKSVDAMHVSVYDSGSVSLGLGWQLFAAAQVAERGGNVEQVLATARDVRKRVHVWAAIDSLENLRRSGRVSHIVATLGTLLQIKPIVEVKEGEVTIAQRVRTMHKATQGLIDLVRAVSPLERLAILHTNYPEGGEALRQRLADVAPPDTFVTEAATAIAVHIGPGGLGVTLVSKSA